MLKKLPFFLILLLLYFSCNKNEDLQHYKVDTSLVDLETETGSTQDTKTSNETVTNSIQKKIIRNGELTVQVTDTKKAQQQIKEHLKKYNAYIQTESFENLETAENSIFTIRVPHENFDQLLSSFSTDNIGVTVSKRITSDDVTEDYTDVSIRMQNKKLYLDKYRNLLSQASKTEDILKIQENIRTLEEEIESSEGRLRYIDDRVKYSTLQLTLTKEKPRNTITSQLGFGSRFLDSLSQGWNNFVGFFLGLISFWPFFILLPIIIYIWKKWKKVKKQNN